MNRPDTRELIARALRDDLSEAEAEEWSRLLKGDPSLEAEFTEELSLDRALDSLPNVPLSSNFTARTLQAALREGTSSARTRNIGRRFSWIHSVFARAAIALVIVSSLGLAIGARYRQSQRTDMAMKVRSLTEVASAIGTGTAQAGPEELFQNFEAIQRLTLPSENEVDMELLVALQK